MPDSPIDQHARIAIGDEPRLAQQVFHQRTARDDLLRASFSGVRRARRCAAGERSARCDFLQQLLAVERLGEIAEHAALRRGDGIRNRAVRGQDDDRQRRMLRWIASNSAIPSMPRMRRSVITAAGRATASAASARFAAFGRRHAIAGR